MKALQSFDADELEAKVVPPIHERIFALAQEARLTGDIVVGARFENDYIWARWTTWDEFDTELHLLVRADYHVFIKDEEAYVRGFVAMCKPENLVHRGVNGLIPAVKWEPA